METIMQYIPLAVSAILLAALILTVITNIIVQVAKQMTWGKIPGVAALVAAGVINTPDYWLANYDTFPSLDLLLCALGGAVK